MAHTLTKTKVSNKVALSVITLVAIAGATFAVSSMLPVVGTITTSTPCIDHPNETDASLVGYYRLDCAGNDDSVRNNHGTLHGSLFSNVLGAKDQSGTFNGQNAFIDANYGGTLTTFTLAGWFKFKDDIGNARLIAKENAGSGGTNTSAWSFRLSTRDGGVGGFNDALVMEVINSGASIAAVQVNEALKGKANQWVHIAATFNGNANDYSQNLNCQSKYPSPCVGLKLYVNGLEVKHNLPKIGTDGKVYFGGFPYKSSVRTTTTRLGIGADAVGNFKFKGEIDEVKIYNKTLTTAEILSLYNAYYNYQPTLSLEPAGPISVGYEAGQTSFEIKLDTLTALVPLTATITPDDACDGFTATSPIDSLIAPLTSIPVSYLENPTTTSRDCAYTVAVKKSDGTYVLGSPKDIIITQASGIDYCQGEINGTTYRLEPCSIETTMVDQAGDIPLDFIIRRTPSSQQNIFDFSITSSGVDLPTSSILGLQGNFANDSEVTFLLGRFNDEVLNTSSSSSYTYQGYLPVQIADYDTQGQKHEIELRLGVNLTVLPAQPRTTYCETTSFNGVTYSLEPCSITVTMVDGQGNVPLSYTIIQSGNDQGYHYSSSFLVGFGRQLFDLFDNGDAFGDQIVNVFFSDSDLNITTGPSIHYDGYLEVDITHSPWQLRLPTLRLGLSLNLLSGTTTSAITP